MWFFYSPIIFFGTDSLDQLENIDGEKVFIVTDKMLIKLGVLDILTKKLKEFGKTWKVYDEVKPDPHEDDIISGAKACIDYAPDFIIGLGGGSSLDTAKSIWAFYANSDNPDFGVDDLHPFQKLYTLKKCPLVAIPTTSGTGAETTWAVVITRIREDGVHIKLEQVNKELIPTYAIVDPRFAMGLPPKLTAATGFDAVSHIFEGMVSTWKNIFSDGMGLKGYELLQEYLPIAYKDGKNLEAREQVHNAATLAGLCFGNSQVGIGHSMGHVMGGIFHTPHGTAVGLVLPYVLQYYMNDPESDEVKKILSKFAKNCGVSKWADSDEDAALAMINNIKELQKKIDFPTKLSDIGITKEQLEENLEILSELCMESSSVTTSPRQPNTDEFKKLYQYAFEGKDIDF